MVKKIFRLFVALSIFTLTSLYSIADEPPDPGGGPGSGDLPVGGGAPIGGGLIILASLGAAYGAKKVYSLHQEK